MRRANVAINNVITMRGASRNKDRYNREPMRACLTNYTRRRECKTTLCKRGKWPFAPRDNRVASEKFRLRKGCSTKSSRLTFSAGDARAGAIAHPQSPRRYARCNDAKVTHAGPIYARTHLEAASFQLGWKAVAIATLFVQRLKELDNREQICGQLVHAFSHTRNQSTSRRVCCARFYNIPRY